MIVAAGRLSHGGLIHAIAVTQPVQSWTVLRSHDEFKVVGDSLILLLSSIPTCPAATKYYEDIHAIVNSRNALQDWLNEILRYPAARENPEVIHFLTYGANMIPPELKEVSWIDFTKSPNASAQVETHHANCSNLDDMEMADMFVADDEGAIEDDDDDDADDFVLASIRYRAIDEPVTAEDEMDLTAEVEMVDDIGSLARSLGASQLGRSLRLQAEIATGNDPPPIPPPVNQAVGVRLSSPAPRPKEGEGGGLSKVMKKAQEQRKVQGIGDSFYQKRPVSAPKLDSFTILKVIGKGSFGKQLKKLNQFYCAFSSQTISFSGKVFLVREKNTGEMFALKALRKEYVIRRNQVEHTKTERNVLGTVRHPFIVGLNMAFQSKEKLYFVLDYCAGGELFFHLNKLGKFPESRARFYAAEIVLAISYVHNLGIIYRDLKPENVLLDARGHVRLTDFGLSKEGICSSSSGATSFCGTPDYLAPEILDRKGHGHAVDWWSLGALLYEMLTGLPPFYCKDKEKVYEKIRNSDIQYPPSLSRPTKSLLRGLLTRDPNQRLGSGPGDAEDIKRQVFFAEIKWDSLERGEIAPPWEPTINGSMDTSQFDDEFTSMNVFSPQSLQRSHGFGTTPIDNPFEGFSFTDKSLMGPAAH